MATGEELLSQIPMGAAIRTDGGGDSDGDLPAGEEHDEECGLGDQHGNCVCVCSGFECQALFTFRR